jgi:hypothetical protein
LLSCQVGSGFEEGDTERKSVALDCYSRFYSYVAIGVHMHQVPENLLASPLRPPHDRNRQCGERTQHATLQMPLDITAACVAARSGKRLFDNTSTRWIDVAIGGGMVSCDSILINSRQYRAPSAALAMQVLRTSRDRELNVDHSIYRSP